MTKRPLFASDDEIAEADALGVFSYFRTLEGRFRVKRLFDALDHGQEALNLLKLDPWDGRLIASLAAAFMRGDRKVLGWFTKRKPTTFGAIGDVDRLHTFLGKAMAEKYLTSRSKPKDHERPLAVYDGVEQELRALLEKMSEAGQLSEQAASFKDELSVSNDRHGDSLKNALELLEQTLAEYESLVPSLEVEGNGIPTTVQDKAIAKVAFLRLRVDELQEIGDREGLEDFPTRDALADALALKFKAKHDEVARLVLSREEGEPEYGLVTRLVPLDRAPDIAQSHNDLTPLVGRFFETRIAQWFAFREVKREAGELVICGRVLSYSVRPAEVADVAKLNANPHTDDIMIRLRKGIVWAETDARTPTDLNAVRVVLRRAAVARPLEAVPSPSPLEEPPYSEWDSRTLWMLELMQRELMTDPFSLHNVLLVNFERPTRGQRVSVERPTVHAVRLRGSRLQDHPEVCSLIMRQRPMLEIQIQLRHWTNRQAGKSDLLGARITWVGNHLAVMTGDVDGQLSIPVHQRLVRAIRDAVGRGLDMGHLRDPLIRIERNAAMNETDELDSVLGSDNVLSNEAASNGNTHAR